MDKILGGDFDIMKNENDKTTQVDFWARAWQQASRHKRKGSWQKSNYEKSAAIWNTRADSFARNTAREKNQARIQAVFEFLDFCGVNIEGMTVLDIGCGPGNYTIPLAKRAAHVWALDPAAKMLDILKARAGEGGLTNVTYLNQPWEEVDLVRKGWMGKFDLVFASMTPGVNDKETMEKMMNASRGCCYVSKFAGQRRNNLQEKLWQTMFQETWADSSTDIIYPFNLIYSLGYFPSLRFISSKWINEDSVEETIQKLTDWLAGYTDITPQILETIRKCVLEESADGVVKEEVEANIGMMIWRV
ncbi:MAG: class I SAM-dependent methyltransferase [Thermincola sp.]|jgi:SAM-dependent methyltransferase|nr:class I SAM-dependent methyltransferase [Thermincola sp.]MDT3703115.1 class I SAM-dependent methyltransferase [Thermincola sp.]